MRKMFVFSATFLFFAILLNAQTPQYAVVRPDGTTNICPTWDSAYNVAHDDDCIYLPGTNITGISINKRVRIFGAGHYPDSTISTGITRINGNVTIFKKCYLEGVDITGSIIVADTQANNSTFQRLSCSNFSLGGSSYHFINGCIFQGLGGNGNQIYACLITKTSNNLISNSIIYNGGNFYYLENSAITNCIFLSGNLSWSYFRTENCVFSNNIFKGLYNIDWGGGYVCYQLFGNIFNNNVFTQTAIPANSGNSGNYFSVNEASIFISQSGSGFNYQDNYHLVPNTPYLTAGTDASQIGIYGGISPYIEGAVPGNPHIYFKQVAGQTNSSGQLPVEFKVRVAN